MMVVPIWSHVLSRKCMMSLPVWSHVLSRGVSVHGVSVRGVCLSSSPMGLCPDRGVLPASPREQNEETLLKTLPSLAVGNFLGENVESIVTILVSRCNFCQSPSCVFAYLVRTEVGCHEVLV